MRLLLAKSAEDEGQRALEPEEAAFVRGEPSVEALMHLLIDRETPVDQTHKVGQILGARRRSGSVSGRAPGPAPEEEPPARPRGATLSHPAGSPDLVSPLRRAEKVGSFSHGLQTIRALFSPNSTPRGAADEEGPAVGATGGAAAAAAAAGMTELVRGSGSAASPGGSPRAPGAGLQRPTLQEGECVEEQIAGLRQVVVNALLLDWTALRASVSEEQLREPSFQWLESVLHGLMD